MTDIFEKKLLYPNGTRILEYFKDYYDSAFVALLPFFKVEKEIEDNENFSKFEILKSKSPIIESIRIYDNKNYPTDSEKFEKGEIVTWSRIVKEANFKDKTELLKALETSIGMYREVFKRPDLIEKLNAYTSKAKIWHPTEGEYDIYSKKSIFKTLELLGKTEIIVTDELCEEFKILNLEKLSEIEFINSIGNRDVYLYSSDKEILFSICWERFFFIIAMKESNMNKILPEELYEGFLCNKETEESWEFERKEIDELLEIERNRKK